MAFSKQFLDARKESSSNPKEKALEESRRLKKQYNRVIEAKQKRRLLKRLQKASF